MALADFDAYADALALNRAADFQQGSGLILNPSAGTSSRFALWRFIVPQPSAPTTSVAKDKNADNSIGPIPDSTSGKLQLIGGRFNTSGLSGVTMVAIDLMNVSGGLSATVTTEQTTNLPTVALARHTSGEGVFIGLVVYTLMGTTATTVTVKYTNQAGTANRVSPATTFGGTNFREFGRLILIPLAAGDTGVRSVESVTVLATTGTAGNFGVCLFKPLTVFALESTTGTMPLDAVSTGGMINSMAELDDDACLTFMAFASTAQIVNGALLLAEA